MTALASNSMNSGVVNSENFSIMSDFPILYVVENEDRQIFDPEALANFFEIAAIYLPKAVDLLKTLPPFDFGPRPVELKGITSMMAVENHHSEGKYIYLGEVSKYDNSSMCGKGIRVVTEPDNRAILMGWFRNNTFTGHGRNIFEDSLTYYEGEFFNFR